MVNFENIYSKVRNSDLAYSIWFSQVLLKLFTFLINTADKEIYKNSVVLCFPNTLIQTVQTNKQSNKNTHTQTSINRVLMIKIKPSKNKICKAFTNVLNKSVGEMNMMRNSKSLEGLTSKEVILHKQDQVISTSLPVSNRNVNDYIVKSKVRNNSTWGTGTVLKKIILQVELFTLALLLRTDTWIYSTEFGNGCYYREEVRV